MKLPAPHPALAGMAGLSQQIDRLRNGARWRALQRRFDQCAPRERLLLIGAATAVALMLADGLWLGPALAQFRSAQSQRQTARAALLTLQTENSTLSEHAVATTRQQQAELASWRARVRDGEAALRQHEDRLVGPDQMIDLLQQMLTGHGQVRVRALQSLGRSDLLAGGPLATPQAAAGAQTGAAGGNPAGNPPPNPAGNASATPSGPTLYRHGVELVLEGGFGDLLQTLHALEALPQHMLWGSLSLRVEQHPKSVLPLRVYTISRDRHWLEI